MFKLTSGACLLVLVVAAQVMAADPPAAFEIRRAEEEPAAGLTPATVAGGDRKVFLHKDVELSVIDLAAAKVVADASGRPAVSLEFTEKGAEKMGKLTTSHLGKPLAVLIRGKLITAPVLRGKITKRALLTGDFSKQEADRIVKLIREARRDA
jgi:preprotein translocase subunit SecD